jgi:uncharacterized protein YybS (DUF2232 family)
MNLQLKAVLETVLVAAISTVLVIILFFVPVLNIVLFVWPVSFIVIGVRRGSWAGILGLIISGLLLSVIIHPLLGLMMVVFNFFLVVGLSWAMKKQLELFEYIVISAAAVLVSSLLSMKMFSLFMGQSVLEYIEKSIRTFFTSNVIDFSRILDLYYKWNIIEQPMNTAEFIELFIGRLEQFVPFIPASLLVFSLIFGNINFLISRLVLKKFRAEVPEIPEFSDWALPKGAGLGFLAMMVIVFIGNLLKVENFEVVFFTVSSLISFIFTIQGLSVAAFFLKTKKLSGFLKNLILVVVFMLIPMVLVTLGVLEQIFKLRRAYRRMHS